MSTSTLVGDVGGTNCRLALAERNSLGTIELHHSERFAVKDYKHFNDVVTEYLEHQSAKPQRAAFAFAGPKFDDEIRMTNVDWIVSEENLIKTFGFKEAIVLNDFVAMANGATVIPDDGFDTLIPGKVNYNKPVAVMGPGTGLGVSCILPGRPPLIIPTEGGHTAFAPQNDIEIEVLSYWLKKQGYVSAETLISGPGLFRLYMALCDIAGEPLICVREDEVVAAAEANPKSIARKSVVMFCDILATFAGNTAFTMGAVGGVVLAGGVTRHISPFFEESNFIQRFRQRGHGSWFIQDIPVRLMKAHFVALYGAAAMVLEH
ncbi:glucokinase [Hellea balneolensis]|uniref:glucokinase n=1 Tax=Hellea balneolensis TaxID=287478 RepID=UPI00040B4306|nr:glucokinase [Hellea balneolensis]